MAVRQVLRRAAQIGDIAGGHAEEILAREGQKVRLGLEGPRIAIEVRAHAPRRTSIRLAEDVGGAIDLLEDPGP